MGTHSRSLPLDMLRLVLLSMVVAGATAVATTRELIRREMQNYNNEAICWGQENMVKWHLARQVATDECNKFGRFSTLPASSDNPFSTLPGDLQNPWMNVPQPINPRNQWNNLWSDFLGGRSKRQAEGGLLQESEDFDEENFLEEFMHQYADFKEDIATTMGNLTCVLTKMKMLDANLQVNMEAYTSDFWDNFDLSKSIAGEDPVWRQKVIQGYSDCYQIASNWPQQSLDRNPVTKVFGRHMIYFRCALKNEKKNCAKAQQYRWLTLLYGPSDNLVQYGLPSDKYDRAWYSTMVLTEAETNEQKRVSEFFTQIEARM